MQQLLVVPDTVGLGGATNPVLAHVGPEDAVGVGVLAVKEQDELMAAGSPYPFQPWR